MLGVLTMKRNTVWQSELSLWQDTYKKSPHKLRPLINLARAHSMQGEPEIAIKYYQEALLKGPESLPLIIIWENFIWQKGWCLMLPDIFF